MVACDATVLKVGRHFGLVVVRKDTLLVEREDTWNIQLTVDDTIAEDLLHHLLLGGLSVCTTDEVALENLGLCCAAFVLAAGLSFGRGEVRSTLFADQVAVLRQISMEE